MTEVPRRPNLFIIGAMKSGTTSLHEYLDTHPHIAMSRQKEPAYFVEELATNNSEEWYLNLFAQNDRYRYLGESSTHYTMLPVFQGVPERLYRFNPDARLIYVMRNPFERTLSHYWHAVRTRKLRGGGGEPRPLLKAVKAQPRYLAFSDYAMQLEPYIKRFGKSSLYALTFEKLIEDPQREIDQLYRWLGLPSHPLGDQAAQAHNQKQMDLTRTAGAGILYRVQFSKGWDPISPHVPQWMKRWARHWAHRPQGAQQSATDIARLRAEIGEVQQRQIDRLCRLRERDFPEWQSKNGGITQSHTDPIPLRAHHLQ